jgi:hypothetical protein
MVISLGSTAKYVQHKEIVSGDGHIYMLQEYEENFVNEFLPRAEEHCLVCNLWMEATMQQVTDGFDVFTLMDAMSAACDHPIVGNYTHRYMKQRRYKFGHGAQMLYRRRKNYTDWCQDELEAHGEEAVDWIWRHWTDWYYLGMLPSRVCQVVSECSHPFQMPNDRLPKSATTAATSKA